MKYNCPKCGCQAHQSGASQTGTRYFVCNNLICHYRFKVEIWEAYPKVPIPQPKVPSREPRAFVEITSYAFEMHRTLCEEQRKR